MLRTFLVTILVAGSSLAFADSSKAAIKADYDMTCNAEAKSGAAKETELGKKAQKVAAYLQSNLKTPEVKKFLGTLGDLPPDARGPALQKAAADAGYQGTCPLANMK